MKIYLNTGIQDGYRSLGNKIKMENKKFILRIRLRDKYIFQAIKNGNKKVDTRAASTRNRSIKTGDKLILICGKEKIERKVKGVRVFKTISALLKKYKQQQINPKTFSEKEITKMYYSFSLFTKKKKKTTYVIFII